MWGEGIGGGERAGGKGRGKGRRKGEGEGGQNGKQLLKGGFGVKSMELVSAKWYVTSMEPN